MRTMHSVVKRGALYWDRDLLPPALYESRLEVIRACIQAHGDAAWLLVGDVIRHGPVVYATNFMPRVRSALAYIPLEGTPVLFGNISSRDIPAARLITGIEDIRAFSRLPKELSGFLQEALPEGGRIGTCGVESCLPWTDWDAIQTALLQIDWVRRDEEIQRMRRRKEPSEVKAIRRSTVLADLALDHARDVVAHGCTMREVVAELDRAARSRGAEDARFLIASGPQVGISLRPPDDRALAGGDSLMIYCAVQNQRYWGEAAQTLVLGHTGDAQRVLHDAAQAALDVTIAEARPGVLAVSLQHRVEQLLGKQFDTALTYGLGNGIGLDVEEAPAIRAGSDDRFQEGDTLALRVVLHAPAGGAIAARTVHIGPDTTRSLGQRRNLVELTEFRTGGSR